jgi:hypothetical protein
MAKLKYVYAYLAIQEGSRRALVIANMTEGAVNIQATVRA